MDVEARIYLPEKPLENVWGYGEVTVEEIGRASCRERVSSPV